MRLRVLIIGLGDLGRRLALSMANSTEVDELVLAGRSVAEGPALAGLCAASGVARVRFVELDASLHASIEHLLRRERPALIVQCASLLSPWHLNDSHTPVAAALREAGFAAQLAAQLPLLLNVMEAVRTTDFRGPVVNCSYPDVTHAALARLGLAPTVGTGNVSMIRARVCAVLRERLTAVADSPPLPLVRVLGHHAHVTSVVVSRRPAEPDMRPRVYLDDDEEAHELAYGGVPLRSDRGLNALSAASALPVIRALLPGGEPLRTSAPGPLGLPGGYPVRIAAGRVELDLPRGVGLDEALAFQNRCARFDGVESINEDGTILFTEEARAAVSQHAPGLCEPLHPAEAEARFRYLLDRLGA